MEHKLNDEVKSRVEEYLSKNEAACSFIWGEDSVTALDENGSPIEDYMIDIDEEGVFYTPVSDWHVTLKIE